MLLTLRGVCTVGSFIGITATVERLLAEWGRSTGTNSGPARLFHPQNSALANCAFIPPTSITIIRCNATCKPCVEPFPAAQRNPDHDQADARYRFPARPGRRRGARGAA